MFNPYGQPPTPDPYPYGQPAAPSQPMYPYGQPPAPGMGGQTAGDAPTVQSGYPQLVDPSMPLNPYAPAAPSQPMYPYGQPAAPSQPLSPMSPYGMPTAPSQPMYPYGMPGMPSQGFQPPAAPKPKKSRRGLVIGLVIAVIVLALLGGGVAYGANQYAAPGNAAKQFCSALQTQDYTTAYGMLSSSLKAKYTSDQFTLGSKTLDQVEGDVTGCKQAAGNSYNYSLFGSTATITSVITRAQSGNLTGQLHLVNENGWKVSGIDTSLLGVNLNSLQAAAGFCAALQQKDYATAYSFFGSALQAQIKQSDFVAQGALHDQIDGPVTACGITAFGQGNSDSTTTMTVSITRSTLGQKTGQATLDVEGGAWKFSALDPALQGSDLGGLAVINQFCSDVSANNAHGAYLLTSSNFRSAVPESTFDQVFGFSQLKYTCKPKLSTFKVTDPTDAQINVDFSAANRATGQSVSLPFTAGLVKNGSSWQVDSINFT